MYKKLSLWSQQEQNIGGMWCGYSQKKTELGGQFNTKGDETKNNATKRISKLSKLFEGGLGYIMTVVWKQCAIVYETTNEKGTQQRWRETWSKRWEYMTRREYVMMTYVNREGRLPKPSFHVLSWNLTTLTPTLRLPSQSFPPSHVDCGSVCPQLSFCLWCLVMSQRAR